MKFVLWTIACVMGMPAVAWGVCDGGMYLNGTTCEKCVDGYYCPGDDTQHPCPTDTTDWYGSVSTLYPVDRVTQSWLMSWDPGSSTNGAIWPAHCFAGVFIYSPYGDLYIESWYNGTNYWNGEHGFLWYRANPGYYLAQYVGTTWHTWYQYARPCTNLPEHAHYTGAGTPDSADGTIRDANDCPWECDDGYGNHDGVCVPLCDGVNRLKTGNGRTFNLYPMAYTTPSLRIEYGGKTCYGVLKSGAAASINVRYNNQTYHLSD